MNAYNRAKNFLLRLALQFGVWLEFRSPTQDIVSVVKLLTPKTFGARLIRVGAHGDGGYLIPNDLDGVVGCFSPGVGDRASFEEHLLSRGIACWQADGSIDIAPFQHSQLSFMKKFLGTSNSPTTITLDEWIEESNVQEGDLILQMDIEGSEYEAILASRDETLSRFRIVVIEFHILESLFSRGGLISVRSTLLRLLKHFHIVHIHPNNHTKPFTVYGAQVPSVLEVTFLRKDRGSDPKPNLLFPHQLDRSNVSTMPSLSIPKAWIDIWKGQGNQRGESQE
jgi:hypothetical protein